MRLRYLITCDKNGVKTEPMLQYWDDESNRWECVPWVECKTWEEEAYSKDKDA